LKVGEIRKMMGKPRKWSNTLQLYVELNAEYVLSKYRFMGFL